MEQEFTITRIELARILAQLGLVRNERVTRHYVHLLEHWTRQGYLIPENKPTRGQSLKYGPGAACLAMVAVKAVESYPGYIVDEFIRACRGHQSDMARVATSPPQSHPLPHLIVNKTSLGTDEASDEDRAYWTYSARFIHDMVEEYVVGVGKGFAEEDTGPTFLRTREPFAMIFDLVTLFEPLSVHFLGTAGISRI